MTTPKAHYHTTSTVCIMGLRKIKHQLDTLCGVHLITLSKTGRQIPFPDGLRLSCGLTGQDCWKSSNYRTMLHSRNHCISFAGFIEFKLLSAALSLPLCLPNMPACDEAFLDRNLFTLCLLPPNSSSKIVITAFLVAPRGSSWHDVTEWNESNC